MSVQRISIECGVNREPPNQAIEPTILGVMPAAYAPVTPPRIVAHLKR